MKIFKRIVARYIIPPIGFLLIYLIGLTCREEVVNKKAGDELKEKGLKPIYTIWHGRIFYTTYYLKWSKVNALVSPSPDGEFIGHILRLFGFRVVWGSTFKNSVKALLSLRRQLNNDNSVIMIADGSRGPAFVAQDGAIKTAVLTGAPIIPLTWGVDKKKVLSSWDKFVIPYPFSKTVVIYGDPIYVPKGAGKEIIEEKRMAVEKNLNKITAEADRHFS